MLRLGALRQGLDRVVRGGELFEITIGLNRSQLARRKKGWEVFMHTDPQPEVQELFRLGTSPRCAEDLRKGNGK